MLTILEAIKLSTEFLEKKGVESARMNAELMLAHLLKLKRLQLYLAWERPLTEEEKTDYREMLKRRGNREPLQYITGEVEFYGYPFKVNRSVLIPRPETELLVEQIINDNKSKENLSILDIGTGSGIIAISLALNLNCNITAIDNSNNALLTAENNARLNNITGQITFLNTDILTGTVPGKFDIIVSNPPYISHTDYENLEPELKVFEPKDALTDGSNGYSFYQRIITISKQLLNAPGSIYFEAGAGQADQIKNLLSAGGYVNIRVIKDYQNIDRIVGGELK